MKTLTRPSASAAVLAMALLALSAAACSGGTARGATTSETSSPATATSAPISTVAPAALPSVGRTATASVVATATATTAATLAPTAAATAVPTATAAATAPPAVTPPPPPAATTAAAATPAPTPGSPAGSVVVGLVDMKIKVDRASATAGPVTFAVKNFGTVAHELVVLKTDVPQDQIPSDPSQPGKVLEPGLIAKTASLAPGASATLSLTLGSGSYVLICNEPTHYLMGMHIAFTIQ